MRPTEEYARRIREMAAAAFADHAVSVLHDAGEWRAWRCQRPDSWTHGFDVIALPGRLLVGGDIGDLWLERERDMIAWARKAQDDAHYLLSKAVPSMRRAVKAWSAERALDSMDREEAEAREAFADPSQAGDLRRRLEAVEACREAVDDGEHAFWAAWGESALNDGSDPPATDAHTSEALWCVEALRWFLAKVEG